MNLSYEEYMSLIPEETKKFVKKTLEFLHYYETKTNGVKVIGKEMLRDVTSLKVTVSAFLAATQDSEIKAKLQNKGFDIDTVYYKKSDIEILSNKDEKELFERYNNLFLTFNDKSKYVTQTVFNVLRKAIYISSNSTFEYNLTSYLRINDSIKNYIKQTDNSLRKQNEIELEEELYSDLPVSTINYLETASRIRDAITSEFEMSNMSETEFIKNDDNYKVPISLFLAIFEIDSKEKEDLISYFLSKGITKEAIRKFVKYPSSSEIKNRNPNLESIKLLYKQYYENKENNSSKEISILEVFKRILDRNETKNIGIEKILEKLGVSINSFDKLEEEVKKYSIIRKEKEENDYAKSFYSGLNADTKEFINYSTKIYQLILEKMKERKHNSNILSCEDDADTLALYIASSFYNTDIEKFYSGHGVTLEKVLKLLNLSIKKDEIDKVQLNPKLTIDRFKRFVLNGVNSNRKSDTIKVNDVARNLCNREFNKSMIMENIFEEIRRDINLPNDFIKMLDQYFIDIEKERINVLSKDFFLDKSNNLYNYLELACSIYNTLKKNDTKKEHSEEENIIMSLLYAYIQTNQQDSEIYEFLGITKSTINKHYGYNIEQNTKKEFDIDTIINILSPYIEENKSKIKIKVFDKSNKNLQVSRFLGKLNLSYEIFENMDELKRVLDNQNQEKLMNEKKEKELSQLTIPSKNIIQDSIKIYEALLSNKTEIIENQKEEELVILSLFLGLIKNNNDELMKKYEITYSSILELLGYDNLELSENYSYETFKKYFKKYCISTKQSKINEKDLSEIVFNADSKIIKNIIENYNINYEMYRVEFIEKKDYLQTLTISERKSYLEKTPIPELVVSNTSDIIEYGNELGIHASYINNEYPIMYQSAQKNSDTENIQSIVSRIYTKKEIIPKKQTWFTRFFGQEITIPEEFEINDAVLSELKMKVQNQIIPLYDDIKMFENLADYMEIYRKKNLEYLDKVNQALEMFNSEYNEIDENDIIKKLKLDTYIKALQAKKDSFILTEQLIKNYIYSIYVLIQTDLITITGLEMSRDTLIPLIGAGRLINSGVDNQRAGINANKFIMSLLGNVVSKNNEGMKQNLEELRLLGVSDEKLFQISSDVNKYINQISSAKTQIQVLEALPLQLSEESNNQKKYIK